MSVSMHVYAIKPADEDYRRKAEAYRACRAAGVRIPDQLSMFFNGEEPDPTGMTQQLDDSRNAHPSCATYRRDGEDGFEIDIAKLPEGTRFIRFYCSW